MGKKKKSETEIEAEVAALKAHDLAHATPVEAAPTPPGELPDAKRILAAVHDAWDRLDALRQVVLGLCDSLGEDQLRAAASAGANIQLLADRVAAMNERLDRIEQAIVLPGDGAGRSAAAPRPSLTERLLRGALRLVDPSGDFSSPLPPPQVTQDEILSPGELQVLRSRPEF